MENVEVLEKNVMIVNEFEEPHHQNSKIKDSLEELKNLVSYIVLVATTVVIVLKTSK